MGLPSERGTEADEGYERLHQAILRGDFQPNERLIELELAQHYNVGRAASARLHDLPGAALHASGLCYTRSTMQPVQPRCA